MAPSLSNDTISIQDQFCCHLPAQTKSWEYVHVDPLSIMWMKKEDRKKHILSR